MWTLDQSRSAVGAQAVGIAQAALDASVGWRKELKAFGKPISELQALHFMVADTGMRIEVARTMVYRACAVADASDPDGDLGCLARWPNASHPTPRCR